MLRGFWEWPDLNDTERAILALAVEVARDEIAPRAAKHDQEATFVRDSIDALGEAGLLGANVPKEYGGMGGSDLAAVIALEAISAACGSTGASLTFHYLMNHLVKQTGSEEAKAKYLPQLAKDKLGAFCLNEGGGLFFTFVDTTIEDKGDHVVVNGGKPFVTSAGEADFYVVTAQSSHEVALPILSLEWTVLEKAFDGVSSPITHNPIGLRGASNGSMRFDQVRAPKENVLGRQPWGGVRVTVAKDESAVGPQTVGMGVAAAALEAAAHHARTRGMHSWWLQEIGVLQSRLDALRCFEFVAARNMAGDFEPTVRIQDEMKAMGGADAFWICERVMEIMGGSALMGGSPIQRYYRDARTLAYLMLPMESRRERVGYHTCARDAALQYQDQPTMRWEPEADHAFRLSRERVDTNPEIPDQGRQALSRATVEGIARSKGLDMVPLELYIEHFLRVLARVGAEASDLGGVHAAGSPLGKRAQPVK